MDLLLHFMEHALEDTLALVPFLFVTYIALEALEHAAGARANAVVRRAAPPASCRCAVGRGSAVWLLGHGGHALRGGRVVTLGTLVAVFLSTSDEMLPMLVAERVDSGLLFRVLGLKVLVALVRACADLAIRALRKTPACTHSCAARCSRYVATAWRPTWWTRWPRAGDRRAHLPFVRTGSLRLRPRSRAYAWRRRTRP